jgi:hypothetical protein
LSAELKDRRTIQCRTGLPPWAIWPWNKRARDLLKAINEGLGHFAM